MCYNLWTLALGYIKRFELCTPALGHYYHSVKVTLNAWSHRLTAFGEKFANQFYKDSVSLN